MAYLSSDKLVICFYLRAGLAFHHGLFFKTILMQPETVFITLAYRPSENDADEFEVLWNYFAAPNLEGKILILATRPYVGNGRTLENVFERFKKKTRTQPQKQIHILAVIGPPEEGIALQANYLPENTHLWIAAVDSSLNGLRVHCTLVWEMQGNCILWRKN